MINRILANGVRYSRWRWCHERRKNTKEEEQDSSYVTDIIVIKLSWMISGSWTSPVVAREAPGEQCSYWRTDKYGRTFCSPSSSWLSGTFLWLRVTPTVKLWVTFTLRKFHRFKPTTFERPVKILRFWFWLSLGKTPFSLLAIWLAVSQHEPCSRWAAIVGERFRKMCLNVLILHLAECFIKWWCWRYWRQTFLAIFPVFSRGVLHIF